MRGWVPIIVSKCAAKVSGNWLGCVDGYSMEVIMEFIRSSTTHKKAKRLWLFGLCPHQFSTFNCHFHPWKAAMWKCQSCFSQLRKEQNNNKQRGFSSSLTSHHPWKEHFFFYVKRIWKFSKCKILKCFSANEHPQFLKF